MNATREDGAVIESVSLYLESILRHEDSHEIRGCVHDAWMQLHCAGSPVTGGWVFRKAKELLWVRYRRERTRRNRQTQLTGTEVSPEPVEPADHPAVRNAVAGLTELQQFVVHGLVAGETVEQQAYAGMVSPDAIKQRIARVREILRTTLDSGGNPTGTKAKKVVGRVDKAVFFRGRLMTIKAVAAECGIAYPTLHGRLSRGMTLDEAVSRPVVRGGNHK